MKPDRYKKILEQFKHIDFYEDKIHWTGLSQELKNEIPQIPIRHKRYRIMCITCIVCAVVVGMLSMYGLYMIYIDSSQSSQTMQVERYGKVEISWGFNEAVSEQLEQIEEGVWNALNENEVSFDEKISQLESQVNWVSQPLWSVH